MANVARRRTSLAAELRDLVFRLSVVAGLLLALFVRRKPCPEARVLSPASSSPCLSAPGAERLASTTCRGRSMRGQGAERSRYPVGRHHRRWHRARGRCRLSACDVDSEGASIKANWSRSPETPARSHFREGQTCGVGDAPSAGARRILSSITSFLSRGAERTPSATSSSSVTTAT